MAEAKFYQIRVEVAPQFVEEQSDPALDRYVFSYHITITNLGSVPAQLVSRHWIIHDGDRPVQEVKGVGVVGEQPLIKPGETFEYTSGVSLKTPVGTMQGTYQMVADDGTHFDADIPRFVLSMPRVLH